jgi:hypothetical protein
VLLAMSASVQAQRLLKATCTPGAGPSCPIEPVTVELGKGARVSSMVACTLRGDGRVSACRPLCSLGEALDRALIQQLELRQYQPTQKPGDSVASSYVFMVDAGVPAGTRCSPAQERTRDRAETDAGGKLLPTCRRLETDRCVREALEVEDRALPYPSDVLRRGVQGSASVSCSLRASGRIDACEVQATAPLFGARPVDLGPALREFLQRRQYRPVTLEGKAVEVDYAFAVTVRASPGSELARAARELQLRVVKDVRARLIAESSERTKNSPICVSGGTEGLTDKDLRPLGRELTLAADCESVHRAARYIALEAPRRAWTGEVLLGADGGWMQARGAAYTYRATTAPLSIQLEGSFPYEH